MIKGPRFDGVSLDLNNVEMIKIAANGIDVWNPAFDVTPAALIDGVVTEVGVVEKSADGLFTFDDIFRIGGLEDEPSKVGGLYEA